MMARSDSTSSLTTSSAQQRHLDTSSIPRTAVVSGFDSPTSKAASTEGDQARVPVSLSSRCPSISVSFFFWLAFHFSLRFFFLFLLFFTFFHFCLVFNLLFIRPPFVSAWSHHLVGSTCHVLVHFIPSPFFFHSVLSSVLVTFSSWCFQWVWYYYFCRFQSSVSATPRLNRVMLSCSFPSIPSETRRANHVPLEWSYQFRTDSWEPWV